MLNVNTIEFEGRKAVINSYTDHPSLVVGRERQLANWQARFPNATVKTERLTEDETIVLVGDPKKNYNAAWNVGAASEVGG